MILVLAVPVAIVIGIVLLLTAGRGDGATSSTKPDPPPSVNRFDGPRAWKLLQYQVDLGPRPAGSPQLAKLATYIKARIPHGRFESVPGHPGLRNIVGKIPGTKPAIAVAAHYDTKDLPGFVGAEDGAGGTAELMELARALQRTKRPKGAPEIRFLFFDGEEDTDDNKPFAATGLRGSTAYAKAHHKELKALVLLDFVAEKGQMRIPYEPGSNLKIWTLLRSAAARVGVLSSFPAQEQGEVEDDHTPFVKRGVPSVDLIDFTFPCWHRTCDNLSAVSERSLDRSGEAVLELLRTWR